MIATCSHCQKKLKLSAKIEDSLKLLAPGKSIRVNCPQCAGIIQLDASMLDSEEPPRKSSALPRATSHHVTPPPPPDLAGLDDTPLEGNVAIEDIPKALILMPESPDCQVIAQAFEAQGYQPFFSQTPEEAMERMQFVNYASVILHSRFENEPLDKGLFHHFMRAMKMSKRRYIFYILTGPEFHTLYDLQALATSANLVVNDKDLSKLSIILHRAIPQYEGMFGPIMQEISALGGGLGR